MQTPDRPPLTDRQAECLAVIRRHWVEHGCTPTKLQICEAMGMSSTPSAANAHLKPLFRKGYLRVVRGQHGGPLREGANGPQSYVLVDTEIVVKRNANLIRIALTGPSVEMTLAEWRGWLEERLAGVEVEGSPVVIGLVRSNEPVEHNA
jgi:hypothetical protein